MGRLPFGVVYAVGVAAACGRSPPVDDSACAYSAPRVVATNSFEDGDAPIVVSGGCSRDDSAPRSGEFHMRCNSPSGAFTTSQSAVVTSGRQGLGIWLYAQVFGDLQGAITYSTDNGVAFVPAVGDLPSFAGPTHYDYLRVATDTLPTAASVLWRITVNGADGQVMFDDLEILDLDVCLPEAPQPFVPRLSPDGMTRIPASSTVGAFWIDRYEAVVDLDNGLGSAYQGDAANDLDGSTVARALSEPSRDPRTAISWYQARAACLNAGKRLCASIEFERACRGDPGNVYPYGDTYDSTACNANTAAIHETGVNSGCISTFGVYDQVGNVREWLAGRDGPDAPVASADMNGFGDGTCASRETWSADNPFDNWIGFRCCRDDTP